MVYTAGKDGSFLQRLQRRVQLIGHLLRCNSSTKRVVEGKLPDKKYIR